MNKVIQEGEIIESVGTKAQENAQEYLRNRADATSKYRLSQMFNSDKNVQLKSDIDQVDSQQVQTHQFHNTRQNSDNYNRSIPVFSQSHDIGKDMWKQLKRVSIPVFTGDAKSYESWKAAFNACVDKSPATPEYKLLQLRQYVGGEAMKVIQDLGHSVAAYGVALERLERKFGGIRRHIALQLEEISSFKPLRPGYAKDVEKFADMLDLVVVNLRESDRVEELGYGSLYVQLLKKMNQ